MNRNNPRRGMEIAPKITSTKNNIAKSTPFLIRKHHLDDSQMKQALSYFPQQTSPSRTYSYQAQVVSCIKNTPVKPNDYQQQSKPPVQNINFATVAQQTNKKQLKEENYHNEYQLRQISKATNHLQKQAQKLRKTYKKRVERDISSHKKDHQDQLQKEIEGLKLKQLQMQKERLLQKLNKQQKKLKGIGKEVDGKLIKYSRAYLILNKPRFKESNDCSTDSEFSSFQWQ